MDVSFDLQIGIENEHDNALPLHTLRPMLIQTSLSKFELAPNSGVD